MEELICLMDTPGLRILYDAPNQWLCSQWLGPHDGESMRLHAELLCACLYTHPCPKVLSDHSLLTGDWRHAAAASRFVFERLAAQGVAYFAWVYSPFYNDRLAMEKAMAHIARPTVAIFDEVHAAYDWLRRMPSHPQVVYSDEVSELSAGR